MNITIEQLKDLISRSGPALVSGPGLTSSITIETACLTALKTKFPDCDPNHEFHTFLEYSDALLATGICTLPELQSEIESHFKNANIANPQLYSVAKIGWSAILSLTFDDFLRLRLEEILYSTPWKLTLTTIVDSSAIPSLTTIPYYALLGDIRDKRHDFSLTLCKSQLLTRMRHWPSVLKTLPNVIKTNPLIFLGTAGFADRVSDFLSALLSLSPFLPDRLVFLESDLTHQSPVVRNLVGSKCRIDTVSCSLTELSTALARDGLVKSGRKYVEQTQLLIDPTIFADIEDQVAHIPLKEEVSVEATERNRLHDALFRPTHLNWAPYALSLEFERDIQPLILNRLKQGWKGGRFTHLKGESGIGKTVAMRSIAFRLAQQGFLCLWIRRSYGELSTNRFSIVVEKLNRALKKDVPVTLFLDDPLGNRVHLSEIAAAMARAQFQWQLIIATRLIDDMLLSGPDWDIHVTGDSVFEFDAQFTEGELARLPAYLVTLGIAPDLAAAQKMMIAPGVKHSRDVLCSLWYLLPQTKAAIEDSLIGEYQRLGAIDDLIHNLATATHRSKAFAKNAYEMVTVASGFNNIPLPEEVLVSALGISHSEWAEQCKEQKPLWGLLYDEYYNAAGSYAYRTRNYVVTEVLLRTINLGTSGHTGEFRCLKQLIEACTSRSLPYKTFLLDVLVERRKLIESRFTLDQVLDLYNSALEAFPGQLPIIEHHFCVAIRHKGGDLHEAYRALQRLIPKSYDSTISDQDSPENLHTSAAATVHKMIKEGEIDSTDGAEKVFEHLSLAMENNQFSPHAHHVNAGTLLALARDLRQTDSAAFSANVYRAARIINRGELLVKQGKGGGPSTEAQAESLKMFEDLRAEIIGSYSTMSEAKEEALRQFRDNTNQSGMALVSRILLAQATQHNRGSDYKKVDDYVRHCTAMIEGSGKTIHDEIKLVRAELIINWQLNNNRGPVYWEGLESDLKHLHGSVLYGRDLLLLFYLAVAKYHLGQFPEAETAFQLIRSKNVPSHLRQVERCFYLGDKSEPQVLEGKISKGSRENRFMYAGSLGYDVMIKKGSFQERPDETKHFLIAFTLMGPLAVERAQSK